MNGAVDVKNKDIFRESKILSSASAHGVEFFTVLHTKRV